MPSPSQRRGAAWEEAAARYLEERGFSIRERNLRLGRAEVDLVAQKNGLLAFVEVKGRSSGGLGGGLGGGLPGHLSVTRPKQRKIARAAAEYLARLSPPPSEIRFDVISVEGDRIRHYPGAFRPAGWTY